MLSETRGCLGSPFTCRYGLGWAKEIASESIYGSFLSELVERGEKAPVSQEGTSGVSPS